MRQTIQTSGSTLMTIVFLGTILGGTMLGGIMLTGCDQDLRLDDPGGSSDTANLDLNGFDSGNVLDYDPDDDTSNDPYKPRTTIAEGFTGGSMPAGWQMIDNDGGTPAAGNPYYGWEIVSQSSCSG